MEDKYYIGIQMDYADSMVVELDSYDKEIYNLVKELFHEQFIVMVVKGIIAEEREIVNQQMFIEYLQESFKYHPNKESVHELIKALS